MSKEERQKRKNDSEKEAMKEAIKEWLNEQFESTYSIIGKWTVRVAVAILFAIIVRTMLSVRSEELRQILLHTELVR